MEISDKTQKMTGKYEMKTSSPISEEKKNPENIDVSDKDGNIQAQYVKQNGKVIQQAASVDAQSTGMNEKAGKKAGLKADEVVPTAASVSVAKAAVDAKEGDKQKHAQKAKLLLSQAKSKSSGGKPKEGKSDSSMSKMASEKTGMADKAGNRDIGKDMAKEKKMEKSAELAKDNMPHAPNSPQDKAHDVVEEHQPVKQALAPLTPEQKSKMLTHLRTLKDKGALRSPANEAAGQLEKAKEPFVPFKDYTPEMHLKCAKNLFHAWQDAKKAGLHDKAAKYSEMHESHVKMASEKEKLGKAAPEGVNKDKYESCVQQVKSKDGKAKNPWAICATALKKAQGCFSKKPEGMEKSKHSNQDSVTKELRHVMKKIGKKK